VITGNQGLVKQLNKWLVLNTIRQKKGVSRAEVARVTGLNSATVSNLSGELLAEGLIQEFGHGQSRGGRRPISLQVNPAGLFAVGVEIQPWAVTALIVDLVTRVVTRRVRPLGPDLSVERTVGAIVECVKEVLQDAQIPTDRQAGIGVATPGLVDHHSGIVRQSTPLGWEGVPLKAMLQQRLGLPVLVERDCFAGAAGEVWHGSGQQHRDLVFLLVDMGVGASVVVNRQGLRGAHCGAAQVGHMTVDINGPRCNCGNYGCLEAVASGMALSRRMSAASRLAREPGAPGPERPLDLPSILQASIDGDRQALGLLEEAGHYLGLAVANIINMYDPEVVVIGGAMPLTSPKLFSVMCSTAKARALPLLAGQVRMTLPHFGREACAVGAATLVLERFFEPVQVLAVNK